MNAIYLEEQNLFPLMSFLRVWAPGVNDPWSASGSGAQLNQFVNAWGGGGGQLCVGASGTASVSCGSGPSSSNAVRMETTLWREIK